MHFNTAYKLSFHFRKSFAYASAIFNLSSLRQRQSEAEQPSCNSGSDCVLLSRLPAVLQLSACSPRIKLLL